MDIRTISKKRFVYILLLCVFPFRLYAQEGGNEIAGNEMPHVDLFSGMEFNYRNIYYNNRLYDLLVNLTPGIKWQMGHHWQIAALGFIPIVNNYGDRYKKVRLNMAVLSKELYFGKHFFKVSGGLFGKERYGIDIKWMLPVNNWLAFGGQVGYTGYCSMAKDWECSKIDRLTGTLGTRIYVGNYNTEFRLRGGRFIFGDYGAIGECMRHFKHCTVRAVSTRATGSTLLIGTRVSCSDGSAAPRQPITLEYDVDPDMTATITAQKYVDGQWVDAEYTIGEDGKVTVTADQFTSYSLLCTATLTSSTTSESLSFTPDEWDNLYGSGDMSVSSASYSYKIGTDISSSGTNKITSYLIEIVARAAGAGVTTATGTYPINVTLPVGTAMNISGQQEVTTLTASALNRSVSGKQYGTVSVITRTWNRQHTGSSND